MISRELVALTALVLGMVAMGSALLPACAVPVALLALVVGTFGLSSRLRGPAAGGIVLGWLALLVATGIELYVALRQRETVDPRVADYMGLAVVLVGIVGAVVLWRRLLRTDSDV